MKVRSLRWSFAGLLLIGSISLGEMVHAPTSLYAADFEKMPLDASFKDSKQLMAAGRDKTALITGQSTEVAGDAGKNAKTYYAGYLVPRMTDPAYCEKARTEILNDVRGAKSDTVRKLVLDAIFNPLKAIVDDEKYAPSCRASALLLIGDLDDPPLNSTASTPPKPYSAARNYLISKVKVQPNASDATNELRVAALVGLHRHVRYASHEWPMNGRDLVASEVAKLIDEPRPIKRTPRAHIYVQKRAIDLLVDVRGSKQAELTTKLIDTLSDYKQHPALRIHILKTLPRLPIDTLDDATRQKVFMAAAYLVKNETSDWLAALQGPASGAASMYGGGMYGGMMGPSGMGPSMGEGAGDAMKGRMGGLSGFGGSGGAKTPARSPDNEQTLEVRTARREIYMVLESAYQSLLGKGHATDKKGSGKGILVEAKDQDLKNNGQKLIAQIDKLMTALGDDTITDKASLIKLVAKPVNSLVTAIEAIPGMKDYGVPATKTVDPTEPPPADPNVPADPKAPADPNAPAKPNGPADPGAPADPKVPPPPLDSGAGAPAMNNPGGGKPNPGDPGAGAGGNQ